MASHVIQYTKEVLQVINCQKLLLPFKLNECWFQFFNFFHFSSISFKKQSIVVISQVLSTKAYNILNACRIYAKLKCRRNHEKHGYRLLAVYLHFLSYLWVSKYIVALCEYSMFLIIILHFFAQVFYTFSIDAMFDRRRDIWPKQNWNKFIILKMEKLKYYLMRLSDPAKEQCFNW